MSKTLKTVLNFRDVGVTVNNHLGSEWLQCGKLYRSARPDESSLADRATLRDFLKVKTIIDLRTTTEQKQQVQKHQARLKSASGESIESLEDQRPLRIPGIEYQEVNFNGSTYSMHLIRQLEWLEIFKLLFLMLIGRRLEAISILGLKVMQPRGLTGLALDSLDLCLAEVKAVFQILADESKYPILIHCTQGKDRTGLVVQLVLMLLDVPTDAIDRDYMTSSTELSPERDEKLLEVHSIGLTDEFAECDPQLVGIVDDHIRSKYGSIGKYLRKAGVSTNMQAQVRRILGKRQLPLPYE